MTTVKETGSLLV